MRGHAQGCKNRLLSTLGRARPPHLQAGEGSDHDAAGAEANGGQLDEAQLLGDGDEARGSGSGAAGARLVDLGQQRVSWVADDGGCDTGNDTRAEGDGEVGGLRHLLGGLAQRRIRGIGHCEGGGVGAAG